MKKIFAVLALILPAFSYAGDLKAERYAANSGMLIADSIMSNPTDKEDVENNGSAIAISKKCSISFENQKLRSICIEAATQEDAKNFAGAMQDLQKADEEYKNPPEQNSYMNVIDIIASSKRLDKSNINIQGYAMCDASDDTCYILDQNSDPNLDAGYLMFRLSSDSVSEGDRKRLIMCNRKALFVSGITEECKVKINADFRVIKDKDDGSVYYLAIIKGLGFTNPMGTPTIHFN